MITVEHLPDPHRGTGRTDRMLHKVIARVRELEAAAEASDNNAPPLPCTVIAGTERDARVLRRRFHQLGGLERHVDFIALEVGNWWRLDGENTFWDHAAVDAWEKAEVDRVLAQAAQFRQASS